MEGLRFAFAEQMKSTITSIVDFVDPTDLTGIVDPEGWWAKNFPRGILGTPVSSFLNWTQGKGLQPGVDEGVIKLQSGFYESFNKEGALPVTIQGADRKHSGGFITGPEGAEVPAVLQSGEFVLDNQAAGMTLHGLQIARQVIDDYQRGGGGIGGGFVNNQPVITTDNSTVVMPTPTAPHNPSLSVLQLVDRRF